MKLKQLLKPILEETKPVYEYGCAMLYFNFPEIDKIQNAINPTHLYIEDTNGGYGFEDEPHTTFLYGLHNNVSVDDVKGILSQFIYGECKAFNPSLFENEKFDVLKFDVNGPNLHETNTELSKLPHTTSYPEYHPHLTIAYLKPGMGKQYIETLNKNKANEFRLVPQYAIYSEPNGTKTKINIRID